MIQNRKFILMRMNTSLAVIFHCELNVFISYLFLHWWDHIELYDSHHNYFNLISWGYMPHNILFYLHFIYATSYSTIKIPIISYLHIYIINMNKKKDNTSLHNIFHIIQIIIILKENRNNKPTKRRNLWKRILRK